MTGKNKSLRTPVARARGLGPAKDGTHHWWMQRVTSIALLPLTIYLLLNARHFLSPGYADIVSLIGTPEISLALVLFVIAAFYHAMLGVQVIIEDYVHAHALKITALLFNLFFFAACGVTSLGAIVYINFGVYG